MGRIAAAEQGRDALTSGRAPGVLAAGSSLMLRRMRGVLAAAGIGQPVLVLGPEEAAAGESAERALVVLACDVSDPACMASLRRVRKAARAARIVVVTPPTDATGVRRAVDGGADGVVFEPELEESLAPSVAAVAAGQTVVPRRMRGTLHSPALSHRERQVLRHVAEGLTNSEIADTLFLSESTVKSHLSSAFEKLGVRSRREAAALVLNGGQRLGVEPVASDGALAAVRTGSLR